MDLFQAIAAGNFAEVLRQSKDRPQVNCCLPNGTTPLMAAAASGQRRIVEVLERSRANLNARDQNGQTALLIAARHGKCKVMEYLARHADLDEVARANEILPPDPRVPDFLKAASDGHLTEVRRLIREGVDVDAILPGDRHQETALYFAVAGGHLDVTRALLEAGALPEDPTIVLGGGLWPPLFVAARQGHGKIIQVLLDAGADVNAVDGVLRESPNSMWQASLIVAVLSRQAECARILLQAGADAKAVDRDGWSAMDYAAQKKSQELIDLLRGGGAPTEAAYTNALVDAAGHGDVARVKELIQAGARVNAEDRFGITPLAAAGSREVFDLLLRAGADVNYRTCEGETALITAVRRTEGVERLRRLLDAGAGLDIKDEHGATALDYALTKGDPDQINCLRSRTGAAPAPSRRRRAGIQSFDSYHALLILVQQPLAVVSEELARRMKATSREQHVYGREITTGTVSFLVFQLAGQEWTILWGVTAKAIDRRLNEKYAKGLSKKLKARAILYEQGDDPMYVTYALYDAGELVERMEASENLLAGSTRAEARESTAGMSEAAAQAMRGGIRFESRLREIDLKKRKDGHQLAQKFFKEQGAFVPALEYWWAPGERPTKRETFQVKFPGYAPEDVARVDLVTVN
jgi:serine/threonine-protein phosphatase 6 regulatory ankyrin repeat subunit B